MTIPSFDIFFKKTVLFCIGALLFLLPIVFSFHTYQIFAINKFVFFIVANCFLLTISTCYNFTFPQSTFFSPVTPLQQRILIGGTIFLIFSLVSALQGLDFFTSFWGAEYRHFGIFLWIHLFLFLAFFISLRPNRQEQLYSILLPIVLCGCLQSGIAIYQYFFPDILFSELNISEFPRRSFGTLGNPNFLAQFLIFPFFLSFACIQKTGTNRHFSLLNFFFLQYTIPLLILIGIFLTKSRASLIAILSGILLWFFFCIQNRSPVFKKHLGKILLGIGGALAIVAILSVFFFPEDIESFFSERSGSIKNRLILWQEIWPILKDHFWWGIGPENLNRALHTSLSPEILQLAVFQKVIDRSHNFFLDILLHTGVIGFCSLFILCLLYFKNFWKNIQKSSYLQLLFCTIFAEIVSWQFGFPVLTDMLVFLLLISIIALQKSPNTITKNMTGFLKKTSTLLLLCITLASCYSVWNIWNKDHQKLEQLSTRKICFFLTEKI